MTPGCKELAELDAESEKKKSVTKDLIGIMS